MTTEKVRLSMNSSYRLRVRKFGMVRQEFANEGCI